MPRKKQSHANAKIKPDMKILLELEQDSNTDEIAPSLSLGSYVEEVMPDGCLLIKTPIYNGYHYPLPRQKPMMMYVFAHSRMYSLTVQYVERVVRDRLVYAKVRPLSGIKSTQRRDCFRLSCSILLSVERPPAEGDGDENPPPFQGLTLNLSDGGVAFFTNEIFEIGETLTLTLDIGTVETVEAKLVNIEKEAVGMYRYKASAKFIHKCKLQKDRFYKFIVARQLEILRKVGTESKLL